MPDETINTPAGQEPGNQVPNDAKPETGVEDFDKDRAMALIDKLRGVEKEYTKLKAADEKRQREQMSEVDRIKAEKTDLEKRLAEVSSAANQKLARASVIEAAAKAGFNDPSDAWNMLKESFEIGDDGEVSNLDKALGKLLKDKPYLLKQGSPAPQSSPTKPVSPGNPGAGTKLTADALRTMSPQEIARRMTDPAFMKELSEALSTNS